MNSSKTRRQKLIEELVEKVCRQLEEDYKSKKNQEKNEKPGQTSARPKGTGNVKSTKPIQKGHSGYGTRKVATGDIIGV